MKIFEFYLILNFIIVKTMPSQQVLDESQLSVVALPPTPLKTVKDDTNTSPSSSSPEEVVSSQILPLHRLSGSTLPHVNKSSSNNPSSVQNKSKPVAEVSPFSNNQEQDANVTTTALDDTDLGYQRVPNNSIMDTSAALTPTIPTQTPNNTLILRRQTSVINETVEDDTTEEASENKNKSPVKDKLQKMRRSITEPLIQYFHDITLVSLSCKHIKHCLLTLFIIAELGTRGA